MTNQDEPRMDKPRRFYKKVEVQAHEAGFFPGLDGRAPKSPKGERLVLPTRGLAELVAEEWDAQAEHIDFARMPATRLAYTVLDQGRGKAGVMADELARYAGSDLLCYLADHPAELRAAEQAAWTPWLDWAAREMGVNLRQTSGLVHVAQDPQSLKAVADHALSACDFTRAGLLFSAPLFGSAVLALALQRGALDADEAHRLSRIDEDFQARLWGQDEEAQIRAQGLLQEAQMAGKWFDALRG